MATSGHGGTFVPPTKEQREKVLDDTSTLSMKLTLKLEFSISMSV